MPSPDPLPPDHRSDDLRNHDGPEPSDRDRARVIQAHQAWVWRYLRFLGCDPALADDLTQDTFVAILRQGREIAPAAMRTYLRRTAASLWSKDRRRAARGVPLEETELAEAAYAHFCGQDDGEAYLDALRRCVAELNERRRTLLELRFRQGLSRRDVAARMGLGEDGIKSLVARTFARLRSCLEQRRSRDA